MQCALVLVYIGSIPGGRGLSDVIGILAHWCEAATRPHTMCSTPMERFCSTLSAQASHIAAELVANMEQPTSLQVTDQLCKAQKEI